MNARALSFCVPLILIGSVGVAQEQPMPARNGYEVAPASSPITIDGSLDEPAWAAATMISLPWEWFPQVNEPAPVRTEALLTFDQTHLYVGFRAFDPQPSQIRAHYADRDSAFLDDTVGFMIDTFNDQRRAFQFRVNPLGVQMEATISDIDRSEDWSWDIIWESKGTLTTDGYVVEIAIPLNQLRFPRTSGVQTWGFIATRDLPRSVRHRLRSAPLDQSRNCTVCQLEPARGFRNLEPGHNLELDPTVTASRTDVRSSFPSGPLESGDVESDAGLTARWNVTPNITLSGAINPDFSHVEADAAQLDLNTSFALFFPEKRPFFLEGADFFRTPVRAVFTRSVADPTAGLKLTGKEEGNAFGLFVTQDEINNLIVPGYDRSRLTSLDQDVFGSVLRYRRDLGSRSTLGALYAGRDGQDGYANHVYGIDGVFQITESDTIEYQVLGSTTRYPLDVALAFGQDRSSFNGEAIELEYSHSDRDWFWKIEYEDYSTDFRADSGFVPRVGFRDISAAAQRTFYGSADTWYRRLGVFAGVDKTDQHDGIADEWGADVQLFYQGPLQSFVSIAIAPNQEYFDGRHYDNFRQSIYGELRPSGKLFVSLFANRGETIDRANSRQADFVLFRPTVEFRIGRRTEAQISHVYQALEVEPGDLFSVHLTQARVIYHLNLRTFVRAIIQFESLDLNPEVYAFPVPDESEEFFTQLLFSYKLNPQTVFLAGYSEGREGLDEISLTTTDRSFFVKIGYAWLF